MARLSKEEWRRRKRSKKTILLLAVIVLFAVILFAGIGIINLVLNNSSKNPGKETLPDWLLDGKVVKLEYLSPNPYSRPQTELKRIKAVVVHYTANPGTTAHNNRNYFEGLAISGATYASSHYIIGLEGEIVQCIPLTEISYASNDRNDDTISIECCHPDETGVFREETYDSLVSITAALCVQYQLEEKDIIRHYDVTGKLCPLYYVENEESWLAFKKEVMEKVKQLKQAIDEVKEQEGRN